MNLPAHAWFECSGNSLSRISGRSMKQAAPYIAKAAIFKSKIAATPEEYLYRSVRDYPGEKGW